MKLKQILLSLLALMGLFTCINNSADSERVKLQIEKLKQEYQGDYRHIPLDTADVAYISGMTFNEIQYRTTSNVFCDKCNNAHARLIPNDFYFDLDQISITFKGNCTVCNDTIVSGYAMHKRVNYLQNILEKRNAGL